MKRRQFGAIRQLPSGRWQARYKHPLTDQMIPGPETFATKGDAGRWLSTIEAHLTRGRSADPFAGRELLSDYAERWLKERQLRPRSVELYRALLDRYVLPQLGGFSMDRITPTIVRSWNAELLSRVKPGQVTVAKAHRLVHAVCATAVEDEVIARNPCTVRGAAVERSPERPVVTVTQVAQLADAIEPRYRVMVLLAAWCGLRLGEVLALTVGDIELELGTVNVDKQMLELKSGERTISPPKTAAGRRVVTIPPHILPELSAHLHRFTAGNSNDLLVTGAKGGPVRRLVFTNEWRRTVAKIGAPGVHYHDLRHTGATLAAATGASTRELMLRLGHSSPAAALRYQHATADRDADIARALSALTEAAPPLP